MSADGMIRLDSARMLDHADSCRRERKLAGELSAALVRAAAVAPPELVGRTRKLSYKADTLECYFGKMADVLTEAAELTDATSRQVLELMDDANAGIVALLK